MKSRYYNKYRMMESVQIALKADQETWNKLPAFRLAAEELDTIVDRVRSLMQQQESRSGASTNKVQALQALGDAAFEIAGAVYAYASTTGNSTLAGSVNFARSAITKGREDAVISRCQNMHDEAAAHLAKLSDYGVTAARLENLRQKIDAFRAAKPQPRKKRLASAAANVALPKLLAQANTVMTERLDKLVVQFKDTNETFFNQYKSARFTVAYAATHPGNTKASDETPVPVPLPDAA